MSLRPLLCLPVLLAPSPLAPAFLAPAPEGEAEALFRQARDLRYSQHWYQAAALYRKLLADHPGSSRAADASYWLAACLEQDQRWDEAAAAYTDFLGRYPDQRLLGREAELNRIRCWGIRQWDSPAARTGLVSALDDPLSEVRVAAALQLARRKDRRAVPVLQSGLQSDATFDPCRLALLSMGIQPQASSPAQGRFLVVRIHEKGQKDTVTIRVALGLARAVSGYLSDEQLRQAKARGIDMDRLMDQALSVPKGTELFSLNDGKSTVAVTVE
ncbi:MAG TPA: tetratricopeptide repeat protein [Holophagaceae bacterium]